MSATPGYEQFTGLTGQGTPLPTSNNLYGYTNPAFAQQMQQQIAMQPQLAQQLTQPVGIQAPAAQAQDAQQYIQSQGGPVAAMNNAVSPQAQVQPNVTPGVIPQGYAFGKNPAAAIPPDVMQQAMSMRMIGRDDLAQQMLDPYVKKPEQSTFGKWKDILTGKENAGLSDTESGVQMGLPILLALYKQMEYDKKMSAAPGAFRNASNQASSDVGSRIAAANPNWGKEGKVL
jgi:hypothetical protein